MNHLPSDRSVAREVIASIWSFVLLVYKFVRWPVTLLIAYVIIIGLTLPYLFAALAWVTLKKVLGETARVTVKLN